MSKMEEAKTTKEEEKGKEGTVRNMDPNRDDLNFGLPSQS